MRAVGRQDQGLAAPAVDRAQGAPSVAAQGLWSWVQHDLVLQGLAAMLQPDRQPGLAVQVGVHADPDGRQGPILVDDLEVARAHVARLQQAQPAQVRQADGQALFHKVALSPEVA